LAFLAVDQSIPVQKEGVKIKLALTAENIKFRTTVEGKTKETKLYYLKVSCKDE
jgi:hypothetical protein